MSGFALEQRVKNFATLSVFPTTGEKGIWYFDLSTGIPYTWDGSEYVESGGGLSPQGNWNADTNTPTLASGVGTQGEYYVVSVAGTTTLDGISVWNVNDWAIFNGTVWEKLNNTFYLRRDTTGTPFLAPANAGDDFNLLTGNLVASALTNLRIQMGDSAGANYVNFLNAIGAVVARINSHGDLDFSIDRDQVIETKTAGGVSKAKMNSIGDGFHIENYGFGTLVPNSACDIAGSYSLKVRTISDNSGTIAVTDNIIAIDYTSTGTVALDLPSAASAWNATDSTGIVFTIVDVDANASANNITLTRAGSDTIIDELAAQTSTVLDANGGVLRIVPINATTWKVF